MAPKQDNAASVRGVALRVTKLSADGSPAVGDDCGVYLTGGFITLSFTPEYSDGDEVETKNAAGEICVSYKQPDTLKQVTVSLEICDPDPVLTQLLVGGKVLTGIAGSTAYTPAGAAAGDQVALGYASEKSGVDATPNGVAIEVWAEAIVGGKRASYYPYWHYLFPFAKFKLDGDRVVESGALATTFSGTGQGNESFGIGPVMDLSDIDPTPPTGAFGWRHPEDTGSPYLYARDIIAPVGLKGCFANAGINLDGIVAGSPASLVPSNASRPENLTDLQALGSLGNTSRWTVGQYVALRNNTEAFWTGTAWAAGRAVPAPVAATGATAGSPGTFSPSGATVPADLAAMTGKTATPTTAWTTGQYVQLGTGTAHWTGSAWAAGPA